MLNLYRFLAAVIVAFGFRGLVLAADHDNYVLSVPLVQKMMAADADIRKLMKPDVANSLGPKPIADDFVRVIDATPGAKLVLERHGLAAKNYGLAAAATVVAITYLVTESQDKKKAAEMMASFTKQTQANIELLRKNPQLFSGRKD